jgi:hypothetical protein
MMLLNKTYLDVFVIYKLCLLLLVFFVGGRYKKK